MRKGDDHLKEMFNGSLSCVYNSKICPPKLREKILEDLRGRGILDEGQDLFPLKKSILSKISIYINLQKFYTKRRLASVDFCLINLPQLLTFTNINTRKSPPVQHTIY